MPETIVLGTFLPQFGFACREAAVGDCFDLERKEEVQNLGYVIGWETECQQPVARALRCGGFSLEGCSAKPVFVDMPAKVPLKIFCASYHFPPSLVRSKFKGTQRSGRSSYDVEVELQDVDLDRSFLCGYLMISGLTEDYPTLTTYFEAEIVGEHYSFITGKWEADENTDRDHWSKFPSFAEHVDNMRLAKGKIDPRTSENVYMRWKEHFLVPDHKIVSIAGASFAGFYYICYERSTAAILGFYFHQSSEMFQSLRLKHVPQRSFPAFKFR